MKKPIIMITAATAVIFMLSACGQKRNVVEDVQVEYIEDSENIDTAEKDLYNYEDVGYDELENLTGEYEYTSDYAKQNGENTQQSEWNDKLEIDFTYDYSENIKADVDYVVSGSDTLQEELENIEKIIQKYTSLAETAQTQGEMNVSSQWFFVIWDTELNSLWSRFSNSADQQAKEKVLADQRNWIDMKEEAVLEEVGTSEENGSMYPMLVNSYLEEITKNRAYVLANELAKITGESFVMPEKSAKYGFFVDNQETGSIYSSMITRQGYSGDDEAVISIYRVGEFKGTFVDNGNGELAFTSNDADARTVKGIIKINGWDGASFTVTEAPEGYVISVGEKFDFPFAF